MQFNLGSSVTRFHVCILSHVSTMTKGPSKKHTGTQVRNAQVDSKPARSTIVRPPRGAKPPAAPTCPPDADVPPGVMRRVFNEKMLVDIMATCRTCIPGQGNEWRLDRIRDGLDFAKTHGLQRHIATIKGMAVVNDAPQFTDVGQSFIHCDRKTGIIMLVTLVRRSSASHWMPIIATHWNINERDCSTTKPHGWITQSIMETFGHGHASGDVVGRCMPNSGHGGCAGMCFMTICWS